MRGRRWRGLDDEPCRRGRDPVADDLRRASGGQLVAHDCRNVHSFEKLREQIDVIDQNQIVQGRGVGDDDEHEASESKTLKVSNIALDILDRDRIIDLVGLEEPIHIQALRTEHAAQLGLGEAAGAVGFQSEAFERQALDVAARAQAGGDVVWNGENEVHSSLYHTPAPNSRFTFVITSFTRKVSGSAGLSTEAILMLAAQCRLFGESAHA